MAKLNIKKNEPGGKFEGLKPANDNKKPPSWPGIISSGDLIASFTPPDYHVNGILQAGFLYSLTASTGTGKTAILLKVAALTALGKPLGEREVRKGRVVYLAGENPADVTMRWIAEAYHTGFDGSLIDVHFVPGTFDIAGLFNEVSAATEKIGGANLVIVDTSAAYFLGADENANAEMGKHARALRTLTTLPGSPCVNRRAKLTPNRRPILPP
jgi:RecA-family ATPase